MKEQKEMNMSKIGKRLVSLRGDRTQKQVADAVGVTISALSMYEQGNRMPRDEIKIRLAAYYNTTIESIFYAV